MDRDEAKAILELCRPDNSEDLQDPLIAEALGLLDTDPVLKAWFDEQQALDARISESINQIEPPADLKASILAGMRAHAHESARNKEAADLSDSAAYSQSSQSWWRNPWIGMAAVFALLFFVVAIQKGNNGTQVASGDAPALQAGIPHMIQFLAGEIDAVTRKQRSFAKKCDQPANLQAYLASVGSPSPASLPTPVKSSPSIGCFTLEYNGIKMGMICFKEDQLMHLTTVMKTDCMDQISDQPCIYEIRDQAFKVWIEGDQVHILSVHGSKEKLPEFI